MARSLGALQTTTLKGIPSKRKPCHLLWRLAAVQGHMMMVIIVMLTCYKVTEVRAPWTNALHILTPYLTKNAHLPLEKMWRCCPR